MVPKGKGHGEVRVERDARVDVEPGLDGGYAGLEDLVALVVGVEGAGGLAVDEGGFLY